MMTAAWWNRMRPNTAFGSATEAATDSGRRDAANQPALDAARPVIISIAPSQTAGRAVPRPNRAAAAEPRAIPMMNEATTIVNAYVVGPTPRSRSRSDGP